ncbi:MAG: TonB-dependent receptor [Dysgonomonas sp.]
MKKVFWMVAVIISSTTVYSQQKADSLKSVQLEDVVVSASRANKNAPIAYSNLNEAQIKKDNAAKNIPFVLQTLPSVVAYSEDGLGIGNTNFRIRGTDANRINVTLNGMPLNNPESQDVFWVNIPDLSNSLQSIQVQRGVGTASNGVASFGGSISLQTTGARAEAYGSASTAVGTYNSVISTIAAGTGIMNSGLSIDARYSRTTTDGYIRNGKVDHKSLYATVAHYTDKQLFRVVYINGIQHTGITWEGVSPEIMETDRTYNPTGKYKDDAGNTLYYDNDTDNYYSNIAQAIYSRQLSDNLTINGNFSYTNGYGYYENYKTDRDFMSKFGLQPQVVKDVTYESSDVVQRKMMSNNFYVGSMSLAYNREKISLSGGGMYSFYDGSHFGKLPWVKHNQNISPEYKWYENESKKRDANIFVKAEYRPIANLTLFGEAQNRYIDYRMEGLDDDMLDITKNYYYNFFNPKAGISYQINASNEVYGSVGISNREPLREDMKEYKKTNRTINPERLFDYEFGYRLATKTFSFDANLYYMDYKDQLVLTGKLSDVGYKLQENVPDSYRMGIELSAAYTPLKWLRLDANTTLSRNKIKDYTAYFTVYDANTWDAVSQDSEFFKSTNISFSPNVISSAIVTVMPIENFSFSLTGKYIGKMYYDNTSNKDNQLDDYFVANFVTGYTFDTQRIGKIDLQLYVNNIFNKRYVANAWVDPYRFTDGSEIIYKGLFPQAPCNIMARVGVRF